MDDETLRRILEENPGRPVLSIWLLARGAALNGARQGVDSRGAESQAQAAVDTIASGAGAVAVATSSMSAAELLNAMARGLAVAAFCPGGITYDGNHWEAT